MSADPTEVTIKPEGGSQDIAVTASGEYSVSASPAGFTVSPTDNGIRISAAANTTGKDKSGACHPDAGLRQGQDREDNRQSGKIRRRRHGKR